MTTVVENRRNYFKRKQKKEVKERLPGVAHRRGHELVNDWPGIMKLLSNEAVGSVLSKHMMAGQLSFAQTSAGRFYAQMAGKYDSFFNVTRRSSASPSYERGYGRDDEIERHYRDGTIKEYERRAKKMKKRWEKIHDIIGVVGPTRSVIEKVCIYDLPVMAADLPALTAGLELLARHFGFNPAGELQNQESYGHRRRGRH